jgi:hypothetical protein
VRAIAELAQLPGAEDVAVAGQSFLMLQPGVVSIRWLDGQRGEMMVRWATVVVWCGAVIRGAGLACCQAGVGQV